MIWIIYYYLLRKFSKNATLFFRIPGTKTGLDGRSGVKRPDLSSVEFLMEENNEKNMKFFQLRLIIVYVQKSNKNYRMT